MNHLRVVDTPQGTITYVLHKKRVKNLNLRLDQDGQVSVSIPTRCSVSQADRFVMEKADWIFKNLARRKSAVPDLPPEPDVEECRRLLADALNRVYPLVKPLGVAYPHLVPRRMKSQWGNCHWQQGYITLNIALCRCPEILRDYVALHELVHFLAPNHGPAFYACMDNLMPEWREHRRELKQYAAALAG